MIDKEYRKLYDSLLKSDDLSSDFTGDWEEDKRLFIESQDELDRLVNTITEIEDEDEYGEDIY